MQIRRATESDAASLWPLCVAFGLVPERVDTSPTAEDLERLQAILGDPDRRVFVAEAGGELVGYAYAQDYGVSLRADWSVARLNDLYVDPAHRNQGIARQLHDAVIDWCATRPVRFLEWQASESAIEFYEHLGYQPDFAGDYAKHPFSSTSFYASVPEAGLPSAFASCERREAPPFPEFGRRSPPHTDRTSAPKYP